MGTGGDPCLMELRESFLTLPSEQFITVEMVLTPAEQRLIWRLRQLVKEQCRGTMIVFEAEGFGLFKLSKQERIGR